jgi:hypothetical protein
MRHLSLLLLLLYKRFVIDCQALFSEIDVEISITTTLTIHQRCAVDDPDVVVIFDSNRDVATVFDPCASDGTEERNIVLETADFGTDCAVEVVHKFVHLILSFLSILTLYSDSSTMSTIILLLR